MQKYSKETVVGVFVLLGLVCIGYMTMKLGDVNLFSDDSYPLTARFSKVTGLRSGSMVNMLGLEIGRVGKLSHRPGESSRPWWSCASRRGSRSTTTRSPRSRPRASSAIVT